MPLLFRKRGRRASGTESGAGAALPADAAHLHLAESPASPVLVGPAGGTGAGVGLVAIWDLPGLNANGDYSDERDGQPPAKVKIQERAEISGESGANSRNAVQIMRNHVGGPRSAACNDEGDAQARRLERQLLELERLEQAERGAQESVLALRREVMRMELENSYLLATQRLLQEQLDREVKRAQELEQADMASKELIESLRERVGQLELELQLYEQYQQHKLDVHPGYLTEEMMYGQFPLYAPLTPAGHPLSNYGYALLPGAMPQHLMHQLPVDGHEEEMGIHELQAHEAQLHDMRARELQVPGGQALELEMHEVQGHELQAVVLEPHEHEVQPNPLPSQEDSLAHAPSAPTQHAPSTRPRRKVRQCYNCQKFGHDAKQCKNETVCLVCSDVGHSHKECDSERTRCVNCDGAHRASCKECPVRLAWSTASRGRASPRASPRALA